MDEQARGTEMPRGGGIRKFMNDPKSSVMSYLAENMAAQHLQQQQQLQQQNSGTNGAQQSNSSYGNQYSNQGSNGLSNQFQNHNNESQTSLTPSQTGQNGVTFQSSSPQHGYSQLARTRIYLPSHHILPPTSKAISVDLRRHMLERNRFIPNCSNGIPMCKHHNSQVRLKVVTSR